jgi:DNA-binding MarR family transcriptional regulator
VAELRRVFDDLVRFETELWNAVDARLRSECGLPLGSVEVMGVVARTPRCRVGDIAAALAITVGGASQAVDRIAARGHFVRTRNPADRRSSVVRLTDEGQALLTRSRAVFDDELERRLGAALPPDRLDALGAALADLRTAFRAGAAARPAAGPDAPAPRRRDPTA